MTRFMASFMLVLSVFASGCSASTQSSQLNAQPEAEASGLALRGSMTISSLTTSATPSTVIEYDWGECAGMNGYDDIEGGAAVTVYSASGDIIGSGVLLPGVPDASTTGNFLSCSLPFVVDGVPEEDFYQVEVANRGRVTVGRSEIDDIVLSLD